MLAHWNEARAMRSYQSDHKIACNSCTTIDGLLDHFAAMAKQEVAKARCNRRQG